MEREDHEGRTNLIINYLPQTLTDAEFKNLFMSVGPVRNSKIVRHKSTGYSYGFGFVDYIKPEDAGRAIDTLNGFQLQTKRIKVAFARPSNDNIKNANLYVRGIPKTMIEEELQSLFSECGTVIQCRILRDGVGGVNKGVGFILFDQKEQAEDAINKFTGRTLSGGSEPLSLKFAEDNAKKVRPPHSPFSASVDIMRGFGGGPIRQIGAQNRYRFNPLTGISAYSYGNSGSSGYAPAPDEGGGYILFVYNIGAETDEKSLWQLFAPYGSITKVNVIREANSGIGKGYGFVTMSNYEEATFAIESLNGFQYAGKPLQVSFKSPK